MVLLLLQMLLLLLGMLLLLLPSLRKISNIMGLKKEDDGITGRGSGRAKAKYRLPNQSMTTKNIYDNSITV